MFVSSFIKNGLKNHEACEYRPPDVLCVTLNTVGFATPWHNTDLSDYVGYDTTGRTFTYSEAASPRIVFISPSVLDVFAYGRNTHPS